MEYLESTKNNLKSITEDNITYFNLYEYPELFYGNINISDKTNFSKYDNSIQDEMKNFQKIAYNEMKQYHDAPTGVRLRFHTDSSRIIFKIRLRRSTDFHKMNHFNSSGFDVYILNDEDYAYHSTFSPNPGHNIFAHEIKTEDGSDYCIFLPNYNSIEEIYMGIDSDSTFESLDYPESKVLPIIFYGNSVTQGASASRSANSLPNITSRRLNRDIINISCSSCCRGTHSVADLIGKLNAHAIVIDYTLDAYDENIFRRTHESFYKRIREYHPDKKIIFLTSENFNFWKVYDKYDEIVENTYYNAKRKNENVEIIRLQEIFDDDEYDYICVDKRHYTDYGMYKVADKICELLE